MASGAAFAWLEHFPELVDETCVARLHGLNYDKQQYIALAKGAVKEESQASGPAKKKGKGSGKDEGPLLLPRALLVHFAASPVHFALIEQLPTPLMKALIADRPADIDLADARGFTPLHMAVLSGPPSTVKMFVDAGAPLNAKTEDGNTPVRARKTAATGRSPSCSPPPLVHERSLALSLTSPLRAHHCSSTSQRSTTTLPRLRSCSRPAR